jgi:hypothetical protein
MNVGDEHSQVETVQGVDADAYVDASTMGSRNLMCCDVGGKACTDRVSEVSDHRWEG